MKLAQKLLAIMLPVLVLLLVVSSQGQVAADADAAMYRLQPDGGILLADNLPVNRTPSRLSNSALWSGLANMTQSVKQVSGGGYHQGVIYIPGGIINSNGPTLHNGVSYYTIETGRWRVDAQPMPQVVADAAICTDNAGKLHIINGTDGSNLMSSHQVYDTAHPVGTRWSTAAAPQVGGDNYYSQGSGCVVIDHVLYLFGGYGVIGSGTPAALGTTWAYDKNTDTWTDTGFVMNTPRYWMGYGKKTSHGYVAGGTDDHGLTAMDGIERFAPATGWETGPSLPLELLAPGLVGTDSGVLVFGGGSPNNTSYNLQDATYLCPGSCPPNASWSDTQRNLNQARWFAGWAGGPPVGPFIAGGNHLVAGMGSLKTAERFQIQQ